MARVEFIEYKGKKILYNNYSGTNEEDQIKGIEETIAEYKKHPEKSMLVITNITDTETTSTVKQKAEEAKPHMGSVKHHAIVGVTGVKKLLAKTFVKDIYFASSVDEAKEWLIKQE